MNSANPTASAPETHYRLIGFTGSPVVVGGTSPITDVGGVFAWSVDDEPIALVAQSVLRYAHAKAGLYTLQMEVDGDWVERSQISFVPNQTRMNAPTTTPIPAFDPAIAREAGIAAGTILLTTAEVAPRLGYHPKTVDRMAREKMIPSRQIARGGNRVFHWPTVVARLFPQPKR